MWRVEIRLAGAGGQGLGLAAVVLAESALLSGFEAAMTQAYGPEARGGASSADVVIADNPIAHPRFEQPALLLVLNQKAWSRFARQISENTLAVIDAQLVHPAEVVPRLIALPFEQIARDELREKIAANMIAVGVIAHLTSHISLEMLERAVESRSPERARRTNREAVRRGWQLAAAALASA